MKVLIKLEEASLLILGIFMFSTLDMNWWLFVALFFVPDLSMLGYLSGPKSGAWMYNMIHHRGIAVMIYLAGVFIKNEALQFSGILLFSHSSFDRMFGYGLKHEKGFHFTHLGTIGREKEH